MMPSTGSPPRHLQTLDTATVMGARYLPFPNVMSWKHCRQSQISLSRTRYELSSLQLWNSEECGPGLGWAGLDLGWAEHNNSVLIDYGQH